MSIIIENGNVTPLSTGDRWSPILNGEIFCAPACGCQCKKVDFDRATERAAAIAHQLGSGWYPHVWENCGWHFSVKKGAATVSVYEDGCYTASVEYSFSDKAVENISETRDDPRKAVEAAVDNLQSKIAALKRTLFSVSLSPAEIQDV